MKFSDLNGDSTVTRVAFINGQAECCFEDGETGEIYDISIPTTALLSDGFSEKGSVHVRLIKLSDKLPIEPKSGIYMAPPDFGAQMQAAREGFLLAVGLRANYWPLFLQIRGYQMLVACPLQTEESVTVRPAK